MVKSNERWINFYRAFFEFSNKEEIETDFPKITSLLKYMEKKLNQSPIQVQLADNLFISLVKIEYTENKNIAKLLWLIGDEETAAPMYWQIANNTIRDSDMKKGEVVGYSSHTMIKLEENKDHSYYLINEKTPDFGRINIEKTLNVIFQDITLPMGKNKKPIKTDVNVTLYNLPTLELEHIFKNGSNIKIEAIPEKTPVAVFEQGFYVTKRYDAITLKCDDDNIFTNPMPYIKKLFAKLKKDRYTYAYIKYTENKVNRQSAINFNATKDIFLNRAEKITLEQNIKQIEQDFHAELTKKMINMFNAIKE